MSAPSLRARVRSEMSQEIKAVARRRLATDGANLSLRAVARDMDIVASALYRYFPSRDALLSALIIDAYDALAAAAAEADAAVPRDDLRGRWLAVCRAVRTWALAHPAEYGLIYGAPVPDYAAPPDTVEPASKVIMLLAGVVIDAGDRLKPLTASPIALPLRADLRRLINERQGDLPEERLDRVLVAWTHLYGVLNFEVFGRLNDMIEARTEYFDHHMALMADLTGLPQ
ncbi:TetR family transcriptional regulator [Kribbella orskensis]|uniref:TetR family transcriptional regulator n=1 Tax=Kribbella orskensis TaxID=2512216 RepID=A0ABY2BFQ0_9ACTN|nr:MULTISPECIES: TetR/AcrR family transcriptional regulator [Kribbella]TCN35459.1 TetR family transcriptional regulator [Kribbella sp. VKM Ac-2500]TCO17001.1 TetR family transcriptional regulator [Kribbella orskensis]